VVEDYADRMPYRLTGALEVIDLHSILSLWQEDIYPRALLDTAAISVGLLGSPILSLPRTSLGLCRPTRREFPADIWFLQ